MFSVVRCPSCGNIQGTAYPIKTTSCQKCGKNIILKKDGILGTFEDQEGMRAFIREIKWKGGGDLASEVSTFITNDLETIKPNKTSRASMRKNILDIITNSEISLQDLLIETRTRGFDDDCVESIIADLHVSGLIFYPRLNVLKIV